jgi:type IV pilus assembly protein PilA
MFRQLRSQKGLTLIELMVVVAIIAIIAAVAITLYQDIQKKAKLAADQATVASLRSAVAIYYGKHNGVFPDAGTGATQIEGLVTPAPSWQCSASYVYTPGNGRLDYSATIADCP